MSSRTPADRFDHQFNDLNTGRYPEAGRTTNSGMAGTENPYYSHTPVINEGFANGVLTGSQSVLGSEPGESHTDRLSSGAHINTNAAFLTVPELAELLHVNEKKIYQLAGCGEIPGTKVTGKWIFPRQLIEDWLLENSHGGVMHDRLLIAGSDDRLVHQVCDELAIDWQQHAYISYSPSGTRHGLRMLDTGRIDACFINWGAAETQAIRHLGLLRSYRNHQSWVIVRCLQRSQGLIFNTEHTLPDAGEDPEALVRETLHDRTLRWAMRQSESGSDRLVTDLCSTYQQPINNLKVATRCHSERSAVASVYSRVADVTCGVESSASEFRLPYLPVADVALDLVMTRKTYFRTLMQQLIARLHDENAAATAASLGGYTVLPQSQLITVNEM